MNLWQRVQHIGRRTRDTAISMLGAVKRDVVRGIDPTFDKRADAAMLAAGNLEAQADTMVSRGQTLVKNGTLKKSEAVRKRDAVKAWRG